MRAITGISIALLLLASTAAAENWSVSIDGVEPVIPGHNDTVNTGQVLKIHIRMTNNSDGYYSANNTFVLYSPDGASWTDSAAGGNYLGSNLGPIGIDTTGLLSRSQFPTAFVIRTFSTPSGSPAKADGITPDTVAYLAAAAGEPFGIPPGFDGRVLSIRVQTKWADSNKTLCIDSVFSSQTGRKWEWTRLNAGGATTVRPTWSGTRCLKLWNCCFGPAIVDNCPTSPIVISHCDSAMYQFTGHLVSPGWYLRWWNLGGPGSIDYSTGLWKAKNVAPGEYTVAIGAVASETGFPSPPSLNDADIAGYTCHFHLTVTDQPITATDPPIASAVIGLQRTSQISATSNDCDPLTLTVVDAGGAHGSFSVDNALHTVRYQATVEDTLLSMPIVTLVRVSNPWAAEQLVNVRWSIHSYCSGIVGNVDCNFTESVDIADLTALIDNLFISFTPLCAHGEANCDGDPGNNVDIGDLTALIDNLFITFTPLPACP